MIELVLRHSSLKAFPHERYAKGTVQGDRHMPNLHQEFDT